MSAEVITDSQVIQNTTKVKQKKEYKWKFIWRNIALFSAMHIGAIYGLYLIFTSAQWKTTFYAWFLHVLSIEGMTAGAHRLWSHRSYKAKLPLQIFLIICQTLTLQKDAYEWAFLHRIHHKCVDTDADPHNSFRGFFFSHFGWLLIEPEPELVEKCKNTQYSDLQSDKILMFQKKYYFVFFAPVVGILIPTAIPYYFWNETIENSFFIATMVRFCFVGHTLFFINSVAHVFGTRPYDKNICPTESPPLISFITLGEGWHNYHHIFPWDYRTAEIGKYRINITTMFLNLMAAIGWAYDLKTVSLESIAKRASRTGDGTRILDKRTTNLVQHQNSESDLIWGWGDKDMGDEYLNYVKITNRKYD
ncbi:hypothetical protein Zmor_001167 [Zophobas morio]|uniref:Fatty acid desaturase domain-containing protein n=1 Tax=Zophobas morio TaxID=2755281 RepID=A0AA38J4Q4_9CUCU|nr:hypothetical protein Zmor_001167 [Zophobas morio]